MQTIQFGLVCEKLPLLPLLTSTYMIGIIVATLTVGSLSGSSFYDGNQSIRPLDPSTRWARIRMGAFGPKKGLI